MPTPNERIEPHAASRPPDPTYFADVFTSAVAAPAISAAWETGMLDELAESGALDLRQFASERDLDTTVCAAILDVLAARDVVVPAGTHQYVAGSRLAELQPTLGFFYWLTRACGELFTTLPEAAARNRGRIRRDMRAVAVATRHIGATWVDDNFLRVLDGIPKTMIGDLGCGSAERLIDLTTRWPELRGVGVDISREALELAKQKVGDAGLLHRISLVQGDVKNLSALHELRNVDLLMCFFMGHDLWPRPNCVASLRQLREALPRVENFLLVDTARAASFDPCPGIFSAGFELAHAAMRVSLPTLDDWDGVWQDAGWVLQARHEVTTPAHTAIFHLTPA